MYQAVDESLGDDVPYPTFEYEQKTVSEDDISFVVVHVVSAINLGTLNGVSYSNPPDCFATVQLESKSDIVMTAHSRDHYWILEKVLLYL